MKTLAPLALVAALTLGAAGCSGGDAETADSGGETGLAPAQGGSDGRGLATDESAMDLPDLADGDGRLGTASNQSGSPPGGKARAIPQVRAVISKGNVSLHSEDVTAARFDVLEVLDRHEGEITDEETSADDDGELNYSRLVLRVPSSQFDAAMTGFAQVAELESSARTSEDVTTQVIDTDVRVRAQARSLQRIEALLAEAEDLKEVIAIETQIGHRQAELDSLKSQQLWLSEQTTTSRIVVHLDRIEQKKVEEEDRAGFLSGLSDGWNGLTALAVGAARVLGVLLPFAAALALLAVPLLAARTVRRRRDTDDAESGAQPSS